MEKDTNIEKDAEEITENLKGVGFTGSEELESAVEEISVDDEIKPKTGLLSKLREAFRGFLGSSDKQKEND